MKNIEIVTTKLVREGEVEYSAISTPDDIVKILRSVGLPEAAEERFYVICVDTKGKPTMISEVAHGDKSSAIVSVPSVYVRSILAGASAIILGHNHPSGDPEPSKEDILTTTRLSEAGRLLGIQVLDHIIVGADSYTSFRREGLL